MFTNAEIVAVGTELLLGQIVNTNAQYLSEQLALLGTNLYFQTVVGDNPGRMAEAFRLASERADLILITGGLGPTMDDVTKDALASMLGRGMHFDEAVWNEIDTWFRRSGRTPTDNNRRQAFVIDGSVVLDNPYGTAPGILVENGSKVYVLMPGPPREMRPMWEERVLPYLVQNGLAGREVIHSRLVRICGIGESTVEDMVKDLMSSSLNPTVAPYAGLGEVHLRVTSKSRTMEEASARVDSMVAKLRERLGDNIFGYDKTTLEEAIGHRLVQMGYTISLAESCTGGLLGHRITAVAGSSAYFMGGVIAYSNAAKTSILGIPEETIAAHGAVSPETSLAMAEGARRLFHTDVGLSVTGIAGPGGGSEAKPVGTVHIGLVTPVTRESFPNKLRAPRADIKLRSAQQALTNLWLTLGKIMKESK